MSDENQKMKRSTKISAEMYNLLIEQNIDGFSVMEARDVLLSVEGGTLSLEEGRKRYIAKYGNTSKEGGYAAKGKEETKGTFKLNNLESLL